jgi:hypothetical protein
MMYVETQSDAGLVKIVRTERFNLKRGQFVLTAILTRLGSLAVFVSDDNGEVKWQGENILAGRAWAMGETLTPQSPEFDAWPLPADALTIDV